MCPPAEANCETTGTSQTPGSNSVNSTPTLRNGTNLGENLHGDWIVVSKSRREHKSRGKDAKLNGAEPTARKVGKSSILDKKSHDMKNKFASLGDHSGVDFGKIFKAGKIVSKYVGPSSSSDSGLHKIWTRKKRPRKEPNFFQPKIFNYDASKQVLAPGDNQCAPTDTGSADVDQPTKGGINMKKPTTRDAQLRDSLETSSGPIKNLPHNIQTTMDVVFVGPNRLRFVDEPKPPNPSIVISGEDSKQVDGNDPAQDDHGRPMLDSMDEVLIEDYEEGDQEMVADTFINQDD
ncbi:hypothetical protein SESBI_48047 [Sesbania bispinosa]|nr:hypothetical protein SESBI_48047 [Sesbania bispinosa]